MKVPARWAYGSSALREVLDTIKSYFHAVQSVTNFVISMNI